MRECEVGCTYFDFEARKKETKLQVYINGKTVYSFSRVSSKIIDSVGFFTTTLFGMQRHN